MPYIDVALRLQLGLHGSCPSAEQIAAACAARGLQLRDGQLVKTGPADDSTLEGKAFSEVKASKARRAAAIKAIESVNA